MCPPGDKLILRQADIENAGQPKTMRGWNAELRMQGKRTRYFQGDPPPGFGLFNVDPN